jgi:hypothetical protein
MQHSICCVTITAQLRALDLMEQLDPSKIAAAAYFKFIEDEGCIGEEATYSCHFINFASRAEMEAYIQGFETGYNMNDDYDRAKDCSSRIVESPFRSEEEIRFCLSEDDYWADIVTKT